MSKSKLNMSTRGFNLKDRLKSFGFAINGLKLLLKNEHNARVHLVASIGVIIGCFVFTLSTIEICLVLFSIGLVFITELLNTAIENISNFVEPEWNKKIGEIKDYSAAAVLIAALVSCLIGLVIFIPKFLALLVN